VDGIHIYISLITYKA